MQLIDRLLFDCLGWAKSDVTAEDHHGGEYTDYTCSVGQPKAIWEAKREGNTFELPAGQGRIEQRLSSLLRDHPELAEALKQVQSYCSTRSVPLAVVCNGHQIVAFLGSRIDGVLPFEGKALVFTSPHEMLRNFQTFWNALSKDGIAETRYEGLLRSSEVPQLPPKLSDSIEPYPGTINRNPFQTDLQVVSDLILEDIIGASDLEDRFMAEAYCAAGPLPNYAIANRAILRTRYAALFHTDVPAPAVQPLPRDGISDEVIASSISRRPILLLGDVGVGKTTFVRHFIKVDSADLTDETIVLYLNLGFSAILSATLKGAILNEIARQLRDDHGLEIESNQFIRGVYYAELKRFEGGIYGPLKEADPAAYARAEIKHLEELMESKEDFIGRCLLYLSQAQQKQVIIFLDNIDQRSETDQQEAFLIAQEIADSWPVLTFLALRPETFHASLSHGALTGYHPKAFTITPPPIDEVIKKRLAFGIRVSTGAESHPALSGSTIQLESLTTLMRTLLISIDRNRDIFECLENLSGGNVREALRFVRAFLGSGHVDTEKIVDLSNLGGYIIPVHEFLRAVIFGDYRHFHPSRSNVTNLFDVLFSEDREHFILPTLLSILQTDSSRGQEQGFVVTASIYERMRSVGYSEIQVDRCIQRALARNLAESSSRRIERPGVSSPPAIRITLIGAYHIDRLIKMFAYVDAMVVDTPIFDNEVRSRLRDVSDIVDRLDQSEVFLNYLTSVWAARGRAAPFFDWAPISIDILGDINKVRLRLGRPVRSSRVTS